MNIGDWMETPQGGRIQGYAFGIGASIVILGALFKIQHWPGASFMLTLGMGTEAVLFAISAFGNPHKTYHWEAVFPQLDEDEHLSIDETSSSSFSSSSSSVHGNQSLDAIPSLSEEDVKKLSLGITRLSDTASQLADLSSLTDATSSLVKNMSEASDSVASFAESQVQINSTSETLVKSYKNVVSNLTNVEQTTESYIHTMKDINKNLSSINSIYELQLKTVTDQSDYVKSVNSELEKIKSSVSSSLKDVESFKEQAAKMSQQVTSLNSVYGNMLNALSI